MTVSSTPAGRVLFAATASLLFTAAACAGTSSSTVAGDLPETSIEVDATTTSTTSTTTTTTAPPRPPADTLTMEKLTRITGDISPKSVVASDDGVVTAQNMMYRHTVTAYDADGNLIATVPDSVTLSEFGIDKEGEYSGAPVEAAFMPGGEAVYVSNYSMYGPGFREGSDKCSPSDGTPPSYLYRISTETWQVDQVIPTGAVPKYVAVTPDGSTVMATNWCTYDMTIADVETGEVRHTVPIGRYPRGIALSPDGATAYVAIMGGSEVVAVDIASGQVVRTLGVGLGPRHLVMGPEGRYLYVTLNKEGKVAKVDLDSGEVVAKVATGTHPRSMDISADGTALYVVNYSSDDVSKLATSDMSILQTVPAGHHPIGISYDASTGRIWVANYSGSIDVWNDVDATA
ncbi:MAG: YncE family protein [Microthrixaceae bacterium]|nr:YncE family protein [Microthrixaceae bacterium]